MRAIIYSLIILGVSLFVSIVFASSLKQTVSTPPTKIKAIVNKVLPQGWGFFTRDPREGFTDLYQIQEGNVLTKVVYNNFNRRNYFGISRRSRMMSFELAQLIDIIPDSVWIDISRDNQNIDDYQSSTFLITIPKVFAHLEKGNYLLIRREFIPWAWYEHYKKSTMIEQIARIKLQKS